MFIISLTYQVELKQVDMHLKAHVEYLERHYALGNFLASGRKVPRTGGVIFANVSSREILQDILAEDPFIIHAISKYDVIEFIPTKTCDELSFLLQS